VSDPGKTTSTRGDAAEAVRILAVKAAILVLPPFAIAAATAYCTPK